MTDTPFQLDIFHDLKWLLKEIDESNSTDKLKRKKVTLVLSEINNNFIDDDANLILPLVLDSDFLLLCLRTLCRYVKVDWDLCTQCALFFNLVNQHSNRWSISSQSVPFFIDYMEKNPESQDLFLSLTRELLLSQNSELLKELFIRYEVFSLFINKILNLSNDHALSVLGILKSTIGLTNGDVYIRTLMPTINHLKGCGVSTIGLLATEVFSVLQSHSSLLLPHPLPPPPLFRFNRHLLPLNPLVQKQNSNPSVCECDDCRQRVGCLCGCGDSTRCKYQQDVLLPETHFLAPDMPDSSSDAHGLFGRVTGQFGYLLLDPPLSRGIWRCTLRYAVSKGYCKIGVVAMTEGGDCQDYLLNFASPEALAFDNMGNYVLDQKTINSRKGWRRTTPVTLEIDMDKRFLTFHVGGVTPNPNAPGTSTTEPVKMQKHAFTRIPPVLRVFTWNVNPSLVHLVRLAPVPRAESAAMTLSEDINVVEWNDK